MTVALEWLTFSCAHYDCIQCRRVLDPSFQRHGSWLRYCSGIIGRLGVHLFCLLFLFWLVLPGCPAVIVICLQYHERGAHVYRDVHFREQLLVLSSLELGVGSLLLRTLVSSA